MKLVTKLVQFMELNIMLETLKASKVQMKISSELVNSRMNHQSVENTTVVHVSCERKHRHDGG